MVAKVDLVMCKSIKEDNYITIEQHKLKTEKKEEHKLQRSIHLSTPATISVFSLHLSSWPPCA